MMAAVDQTGLVSLKRSRIWNVLARLPVLSAASDAVITVYFIPQYGISSKTLDSDAAADAGGRRLCVHVTARQHRPLSSSRRPRHPTTRPMGRRTHVAKCARAGGAAVAWWTGHGRTRPSGWIGRSARSPG